MYIVISTIALSIYTALCSLVVFTWVYLWLRTMGNEICLFSNILPYQYRTHYAKLNIVTSILDIIGRAAASLLFSIFYTNMPLTLGGFAPIRDFLKSKWLLSVLVGGISCRMPWTYRVAENRRTLRFFIYWKLSSSATKYLRKCTGLLWRYWRRTRSGRSCGSLGIRWLAKASMWLTKQVEKNGVISTATVSQYRVNCAQQYWKPSPVRERTSQSVLGRKWWAASHSHTTQPLAAEDIGHYRHIRIAR